MATLLQIRDRVKRLVIDLPTSVLTDLDVYINAALTKLQQKRNFRVMETETADLITTAGTRVLAAVPANLKELREAPYTRTNIGQPHELAYFGDRNDALSTFSVGVIDIGPPAALLETEMNDTGARNWEVWPLSDGASDYPDKQYRIRVPYWRFLPALVGDGDTNWFTAHAVEWLVKQATAEAFYADWDEQRAVVWETRAGREFVDAVLADKRAMLAGVTTLVPLWQGADSPRIRR